jgi:hypothetical protein
LLNFFIVSPISAISISGGLIFHSVSMFAMWHAHDGVEESGQWRFLSLLQGLSWLQTDSWFATSCFHHHIRWTLSILHSTAHACELKCEWLWQPYSFQWCFIFFCIRDRRTRAKSNSLISHSGKVQFHRTFPSALVSALVRDEKQLILFIYWF